MSHTERIANYCNDQGVLDILEEIGDYLDSIDLDSIKIREGRQNKPKCCLLYTSPSPRD